MVTLQKTNGSKSKKKEPVDTTAVPHNGKQHRLVSESAYYRAQSRNFEGGDPVEDWLAAEKEIGSGLSAK